MESNQTKILTNEEIRVKIQENKNKFEAGVIGDNEKKVLNNFLRQLIQINNTKRAQDLQKKESAGTITKNEKSELNKFVREWSRVRVRVSVPKNNL